MARVLWPVIFRAIVSGTPKRSKFLAPERRRSVFMPATLSRDIIRQRDIETMSDCCLNLTSCSTLLVRAEGQHCPDFFRGLEPSDQVPARSRYVPADSASGESPRVASSACQA